MKLHTQKRLSLTRAEVEAAILLYAQHQGLADNSEIVQPGSYHLNSEPESWADVILVDAKQIPFMVEGNNE